MMKKHLLVIVVGIVLTIILTWPYALNMGSFFSDQGDYPFNVAQLWYNQDSIKTGRIFNLKEYIHGYQFYPQPYSFAFANNAFVPSLIFAPMYWITGNIIFSGNFYTFLTFVLSFLAAFYAVNYFVKNPYASLIGAFVFTFNANTLVRFPQHIDVLGKYFLPLVFLFAYQFLEKPTLRKGLLFALFFTLNALTNNYYEIFTIILLPILTLTFFIKEAFKKNWSYFLSTAKFGAVFLIFLPILLYFNLPYLEFSQKEGVTRTLGDTIFFSARINDWFASSPDNFLYGGWMRAIDPIREPKDDRGILNYEEHSLFLGLVPLILFFLGLKTFHSQKINRAYFYLLLIIPVILMLGPFFNGAESFFKLPFYFLYDFIPILRGIRSPTRFEFVLLLPFAIIASFGAKRLLEGRKNIKIITIIITITVILILENLTPKDFSLRSNILSKIDLMDKAKLQTLSNKITLHLPIYDTSDADNFGNNSGYLNLVTQTGGKIVNGNTSYLPSDQLVFLSEIKRDGLSDQNILKLKALGVEYVVVHKPEIEIVDLGKTNLNPKICNFSNDFDIQFGKAAPGGVTSEETTYAISLKNMGSCYLPSIYEDRYRSINVEIDGKGKKAHLRMPIIIGPLEQVVLSEINRELRIE